MCIVSKICRANLWLQIKSAYNGTFIENSWIPLDLSALCIHTINCTLIATSFIEVLSLFLHTDHFYVKNLFEWVQYLHFFFIEVTITKIKLDSLTFSSVWLCALEELEPKLEKDRFVLVQVAKLVSSLKSVSLETDWLHSFYLTITMSTKAC